MTDINHTQLKNVLKASYKSKVPVFIWGTMGIGKSTVGRDVTKEISAELGKTFLDGKPNGEGSFGFIDVRISQLEPSDLRGLPNIKDNSTTWITPDWLPKEKDSCGILFFDELNLAPPSIQAAAYQLINDRKLGNYTLPDGWYIIAAGNTSKDKAHIYELSAPLENRFSHVTLSTPTIKDWTEWGLKNGICTDILSFLEFKPSLLYSFDAKNRTHAFPTPRSWEFCNRLITENNPDDALKEVLVASAVGDGVSKEFSAFLKLKKKINIKEILDKPESVKTITALDLKHSLLSVVTEAYAKDKKVFSKVVKVAENLEPSFSIQLLRYLSNTRKEFKKELLKDETGERLLTKYAKYLTDIAND